MQEIYHYGIKRRSGRYPWGSGKNPRQGESQKKKQGSNIGTNLRRFLSRAEDESVVSWLLRIQRANFSHQVFRQVVDQQNLNFQQQHIMNMLNNHHMNYMMSTNMF